MAAPEEIVMEEVSRRRSMVRREEGQGSSGRNIHAPVMEELSIQIDPTGDNEWLRSLANEGGVSGDSALANPKIQKVPPMLRGIESNKKCYDPLVVSIGPFHHGKSELEPMEKHKDYLAKQYAKKCKVSLQELHKRLEEVVESARKCYTEDSTQSFDDKAFARMMFLDGCFLLQFIYCLVHGNHKDLKMKSHDMAFVRRDFFLLENQLPFQVLKVLMNWRFERNEGEKIITMFINRSRAQQEGLLGLEERSDRDHLPTHLLEIVREQLIDVSAFYEGGCYLRGEWLSYRSAKELRTVGIHFKRSESQRFSDIKFESSGFFSSHLRLPPITIDDSTKSKLLNLVAYEACPDTPDDFGVTSYVCFMDSIIDHDKDVEELRSKGILLNFLGSDEQVADLFNEIATDLVPNPHGYAHVKECIENHYKNKTKVWMAEWRHAHFSSPWTVITFVLAIFAILLSVTQTILAVFQTFFT
ncbi:unnamed protein product [Ilex paraguariensis]|uniref:Uncharacterized protein n=1 Tax=Ilex paraguariensis TaxID=185542 RepID=A0ABC8UXW6_9AQUA